MSCELMELGPIPRRCAESFAMLFEVQFSRRCVCKPKPDWTVIWHVYVPAHWPICERKRMKLFWRGYAYGVQDGSTMYSFRATEPRPDDLRDEEAARKIVGEV